MSQTSYSRDMTQAFPGMFGDAANRRVVSAINAEASASFPAGIFVAEGSSDQDGRQAILQADGNSKLMGVVVNYANRENDADIAPDNMADVLEEGAIWVLCEEAMAVGNAVYARHTANGAGKLQKGAVRNDSDTSNATLVKGARVLDPGTSSASGGVALIYFSSAAQFATL